LAIVFDQVNFSYDGQAPVLQDVNLTLASGQVTAIIGQTGAGKSTLMQHVNGLLKPTSGQVRVEDFVLDAQTKEKTLVALRKRVGMVFQFPENQLFANTVLADVMYGPLNFGLDKTRAQQAAQTALQRVGLPEQYWQVSPFDLSGGQMRRVALAGVLASEPEILVLDEPAAGLDPKGQADLLAMIASLRAEGTTVLLITHQMEHVVAVADHVVVMGSGAVQTVTTPEVLFQHDSAWFAQFGLALPKAGRFAELLAARGMKFDRRPLTKAALSVDLNARIGGERDE
jgi:energy-coupling factor transport system ATP-binding protein